MLLLLVVLPPVFWLLWGQMWPCITKPTKSRIAQFYVMAKNRWSGSACVIFRFWYILKEQSFYINKFGSLVFLHKLCKLRRICVDTECLHAENFSDQPKEYLCKVKPLYSKLQHFIVLLPLSNLLNIWGKNPSRFACVNRRKCSEIAETAHRASFMTIEAAYSEHSLAIFIQFQWQHNITGVQFCLW